jgi:hypothetical protein
MFIICAIHSSLVKSSSSQCTCDWCSLLIHPTLIQTGTDPHSQLQFCSSWFQFLTLQDSSYQSKTVVWAEYRTDIAVTFAAQPLAIFLCNPLLNPLCTILIIWEDSSTSHHNKTPTERGQLMENPVYTWVEGCSPQAILVYEGTNSKTY